ncbi:GH12 family glycosyl hydrolase domain-containing protein [Streptomyces violascens]|uniref:GH12 family glycosyl hydrolase domain-containing protein n=1 Tax=Streptomyces violascens TaxID=67381 RepID=UPI003698A40B
MARRITAHRLTRSLLTSALALGATIAFASAPAQAAAWSTCDRWGSTSLNGYTLYNNIWGSGAGSQCSWANSGSSWGTWAAHPNTGGIKAYPNSTKDVNRTLSGLASLSSSYNVSVPSAGAYNSSYDIWDAAHKYEIMLWVNKTGPVGPIGTLQGSVSLGGHSWDVYKGSNGSNQVFSFLRTSNSSSGTVDILPILRWIANTKGWMPSDELIGTVQFGFEITSAAGGLNFTANNVTVSSS